MTMYSDPIADMLTRIRNAQRVGHNEVSLPKSKLKAEIAKILVKQGFIKSFSMVDERTLSLQLKYDRKGEPIIQYLKKVSKPGLRVYSKATRLPRILGGAGTAIVSTSKGLLTDQEARTQGVGGEVLCYVY
ncbi:MAG: 30S ribosomal protein S8 [Candidatus Melainabacteria bacterium]|nr:30S ribosomal protein S8 [Candidatus Melainabacteria bacterium]